jgi:hypothetical protein
MEHLTPPSVKNSQEISHIFASRILESKSNKEAAIVFSQISPHEGGSKRKTNKHALAYLRGEAPKTGFSGYEQRRLEAIRDHLKNEDQKYLESKQGNFTQKDKVRLLFQAKSKYLSGMSKKESISMYKEAGYSDDEINKITLTKTLVSAGIGFAMAGTDHAAKILVTINDKLLPITDNLPANTTGAIVAGSLIAYTGTYALLTEANMKLTKKAGISANALVTSLYFLSDKLLPNKTRDWISRGTPIALDTAQHAALYTIPTLAATGDPNKVVAATLVSTAINLLYAAGSFAVLGIKNKFGRSTE